jgi:DNA-binding response OmpR family regulator
MTDKILIVDDEAPIRRLLWQTLEDLEDEGVELMDAEDGLSALALIEAEHPRLVILDVMMPQMDGFEVCQRVRSQPGMGDVTIILLTAKGQEVDRQQGQEVGADLYLTKPFDPDDLLQRAAQILGINLS